MNTVSQAKPQEVNLQECATQVLTDESLPAAQVIEEQRTGAENTNTPRFIP